MRDELKKISPLVLRKYKGKYVIALNTYFAFYCYSSLGIPVEITEGLAKKYYPKSKKEYVSLFDYLFVNNEFEESYVK